MSTRKRIGYYIVAADGTWKRGINLLEIQENYMSGAAVKVAHHVYSLIANNCSDEELTNLLNCYYVDDDGYITRCSDLSISDSQSLKDLFVGWAVERRLPLKKRFAEVN